MTSIRVADRYVLDREIGRGGSGAVWLARDEVLGRSVALKRIGLPPGASASDLDRAEREAKLAARVNHPNVTSVFDFVHEGDQHWLVMEHVDGTTLAQRVRERGPLPPDEAAPLLLQAAEALAAAHRMGIVHRDVKPSNILIARDGTAKLSDFGIARGLADPSLTQTGLVTGSPSYLAPEVATGASATPASDVWSFGTTVFHTLAGRPPYEGSGEGAGVLAILYRIAHEPPPRLEDAGWLAPLLDATMDQDPARRRSMDEVVAFLRAGPAAPPVLSTQVMPAAPPPPPQSTMVTGAVPSVLPAAVRGRSAWRAAVVGLVVVTVLALVGLVLLVAGDGDEPPATGSDGSATSAGRDETSAPSEPLPTVAELESFATSYVETAADDPDAGFALLTAGYQERSPDYTDFWGTVKKPEILDVSADPAALTVTYTYRYQQKRVGKREETVTLQLVQEGDQLLIDDAFSS